MVTLADLPTLLAQLAGLAILAGTLAAVAAAVFRWYADYPVPRGLAVLVGLSGVALYLNTTDALAEVITQDGSPTAIQTAVFNIAAFAVGAGAAEVGRRVGDRFQLAIGSESGSSVTEGALGRFGRAVGRARVVTLPAEIDEVVGYDPVDERTKAALSGRTFVFRRGLATDAVEAQLVARLKAEYPISTVDLDVAPDGTVDHLALGRRAAGIGPTLPPGTVAVVVRADPPYAASAGDLVQVWETDPARRVLTGELRGVAGEAVTLAVDAADAADVDPSVRYRLVTLPVEDHPDREFVSLLRAAEETFGTVTVAAGSPLDGLPVGALSVSVLAVSSPGAPTVVLPRRDYRLAADAVVAVVERPERLRHLETAAATVPARAAVPGDAGDPAPDGEGSSGPGDPGAEPPD